MKIEQETVTNCEQNATKNVTNADPFSFELGNRLSDYRLPTTDFKQKTNI